MPKYTKKAAPKKAAPKKAAPKKAAPKKAEPKKAESKKAAPKPSKVLSTVCLEGYKISKAGRCIKDKKYQTIVATIPMPPPPPGMKAAVSKPKTVAQMIAQFEEKKKGRMVPMKLREGNTVTFGLKKEPQVPPVPPVPPMILL